MSPERLYNAASATAKAAIFNRILIREPFFAVIGKLHAFQKVKHLGGNEQFDLSSPS